MCSAKALRHAKGDCGDKSDGALDQETKKQVGYISFGLCWYGRYVTWQVY